MLSGDLRTTADWVAVLKVASRLDFVRHRDLAVTKLVVLTTPIERIQLGKSFDIPSWLGRAYREVCLRDTPLTVDEGHKVGLVDAVKISAVRESIARRGPDAQSTALFEATFGEPWLS